MIRGVKKRSNTRILRDKAWKVFADWIKNRDQWTCITCGKKAEGIFMNAGHFIHGRHMDFIEENISAQCSQCNKWKHGNLAVYAIMIDRKWGAGTAEKLYKLSKTYRGYRKKDYEDVIQKYQ